MDPTRNSFHDLLLRTTRGLTLQQLTDDQTRSLPSQAETRMQQNLAPLAPKVTCKRKAEMEELSCGEERALGWEVGSWGLHPRLCPVLTGVKPVPVLGLSFFIGYFRV